MEAPKLEQTDLRKKISKAKVDTVERLNKRETKYKMEGGGGRDECLPRCNITDVVPADESLEEVDCVGMGGRSRGFKLTHMDTIAEFPSVRVVRLRQSPKRVKTKEELC